MYKVYMAIIIHCTDSKWKLSSTILECKRLPAHTGESPSTILQELIKNCELEGKILTIAADNGSDIMSGILILTRPIWNDVPPENQHQLHHLRCVAHVINHAMKDFSTLVQREVFAIRRLISAIQCPV